MEKHYRFAGVELTIDIPDDLMYENERNMSVFAAGSVSATHTFCFRVKSELDKPVGVLEVAEPNFLIYRNGDNTVKYIGVVQGAWEEAYIRVDSRGREHLVQVRRSGFRGRIGVHTVLNALGAEHLIAQAGGLVFHCSYIERDGKAILFTAPSETGKSTQAELWHKYRNAEIINGDRAAIRIENGRILAEGIPFAGSSSYCQNRSLCIEAIVYLTQASETSIRHIRGYEAFSRIWEGVSVNTWNRKDMERVSDVVQRTAQTVPVFHLCCTPDESAVIALEQALRK